MSSDSGTPTLRLARPEDVPQLQDLIRRSARSLSAGFYSAGQIEALVEHVFGVDSQLIEDGTYFVMERGAPLVACGGWSRRKTLFGGDQAKAGPDDLLVPSLEPARIRAFFVDPASAKQGLGRRLLLASLEAARKAGFSELELVATLPGEPFYSALGFEAVAREEIDLPGGITVPVTRMRRRIRE